MVSTLGPSAVPVQRSSIDYSSWLSMITWGFNCYCWTRINEFGLLSMFELVKSKIGLVLVADCSCLKLLAYFNSCNITVVKCSNFPSSRFPLTPWQWFSRLQNLSESELGRKYRPGPLVYFSNVKNFTLFIIFILFEVLSH